MGCRRILHVGCFAPFGAAGQVCLAVFFVPSTNLSHPEEETNPRMYNPDFWEVQIEQTDLERMSREVGLWFESEEDQKLRYALEDRTANVGLRLDTLMRGTLTQKQFEAVVLYFKFGKTQQEISEIMGMSRRVVSQHLFGITRNGKSVGGAVKKIRKLCRKRDIAMVN